MKKVLLKQRYQYFEITPFKDYSPLSKKEQIETNALVDVKGKNINFLEDLFISVNGDTQELRAFNTQSTKFVLYNKKASKKKNTKYFYTNEDKEVIELFPWHKTNTFYTDNEKHLLKHFGRPLSSIIINTIERTISIDDDTISVRCYNFKKFRGVNSKFFKRSSYSVGFKINFKTGNIIAYDGQNKTTKIRQNHFRFLTTTILTFLSRTLPQIDTRYGYNKIKVKTKNHPVNETIETVFNNKEFLDTFKHALLSKIPDNNNLILITSQLGKVTHPNTQSILLKTCMELFISLNNLKVPNNYESLLTKWYPTKLFLKKNENKLIAAILDRLKLKTKSIIKLVHQRPNMPLENLILLAKYFGYGELHKYIHNIDPNFLDIEMKENSHLENIYTVSNNHFEFDLRPSEKKCVLKLINNLMQNNDTKEVESRNRAVANQIGQFTDHIDMVTKIRNYLPDVEIRATDLIAFHNEHIEFSKIQRAIKKGYSIKYVFDQKLIDHIEKEIRIPNENILEDGTSVIDNKNYTSYYPVILKIDAEYTEEGSHMHHCVATYADRENSIIISVREGSPTGHERVTCEYNINKKVVQEKYFCNAVPPERFEKALEKVAHRVLFFSGSIKSISKEKIPLIINGVQIEQKAQENPTDFFLEYLDGPAAF